MKRIVTFILLGGAIVAVAGSLVATVLGERVTVSSPSPDGQMRAVLVERPGLPALDRNFQVRIERAEGIARTVFTSPDEPPAGRGTDRLLWSTDGDRLLLVGRRYFVREGAGLKNGNVLYLLVDLPTERVWCNSDQPGFEPFGVAELTGFDFGEELAVKDGAVKDSRTRP